MPQRLHLFFTFTCGSVFAVTVFEKAKFRCGHCKVTRYCSKQCQRRAWKTGGHSKECRVLIDYFRGKSNATLDIALLSDAILLGRTCRRMKKHRVYKDAVLGMVFSAHSKEITSEAAEIAHFVRETGLASSEFDLEGILLRFRCNNFAIVNSLFQSTASAIYPVGAMLNHSCQVSCIPTYRTLSDGTIEQQFRAARNIKAGNLTHSYCDIAFSARNEHLGRFYNFQCTCDYCTGKDATKSYGRFDRGKRQRECTSRISSSRRIFFKLPSRRNRPQRSWNF